MMAPVEIVPPNQKGKALDVEETATCKSYEDAIVRYLIAYRRLLNPSVWPQVSKIPTLDIQLITASGEKLDRFLQVGDYLRIDIPGPGPSLGAGYDWMKVAALQENFDLDADKSLAFKLEVSADPTGKDNRVAHFFERGASSSFVLKWKDKTLTVSYHGRNEVANNGSLPLTDKVRNSLITLSARARLSNTVWKSLVAGLLLNKG